MNTKRLAEQLAEWMRSEVTDAGGKGVVVGLSGGIDSSTVAVLAKRAFRDDHLGVILPVHSSPRDREDALLVVDKFHLKSREIGLEPVFDAFLTALGVTPGQSDNRCIAVANLKPRLRMAGLYYLANENGYLVVGTGNRSELSIGYFTKYGDGGVDLLPLGHLVKEEVRELATFLGVPQSVIDKPPSAGIWAGQTDESELGFSYEQLDAYLMAGEGEPELAERIDSLRRGNAHKLRTPKLPPAFHGGR